VVINSRLFFRLTFKMTIYYASTTAPVNIAVIKYWGKRDKKLNLPTNSSISVTLSQDDLQTYTTAACSSTFTHDQLWLNGKLESIQSNARMTQCIEELRSWRRGIEEREMLDRKLSKLPLHICSKNNFPTAAGLASSASGFAALVQAIARLYQIHTHPSILSRIARLGSGSACRSLFGGFVAWEMGTQANGEDSKAVQIAPKAHWPAMKAIILVASAEKKKTASTLGMTTTTETSTLFDHRVKNIVPRRMEEMKKAIREKDFETFGKLTMADSNQFHAVCLDTQPPIFYLNEESKAAIQFCVEFNQACGRIVVAYTFDAGPNAVFYFLEEDESNLLGALQPVLGDCEGFLRKDDSPPIYSPSQWVSDLLTAGIQRVILTGVGDGPKEQSQHLLDEAGLPT